MENKQELIEKIKTDLANGLTWQAIKKKYELKSTYLLRLAVGSKTIEDYDYITIRINKSDFEKLNTTDLFRLHTYLTGVENVLKNNKGVKKAVIMAGNELNSRV